MDPLTAQAAAKGAVVAGAGSAFTTTFTILDNMADLTGWDWGLVIFLIVAGISLGAYQTVGEVEADYGSDSPEAKKARKLALSRSGVQFCFGIMAAAAVDGNPWKLLGACLIIGMGGPTISDIIKKFISIGGGK